MDNIVIRKGRPEDAKDFAHLAVYTAGEYFEQIFGTDALPMLERLFRHPKNIFSFNNSFFLEVNGKTAGMTLFYSHDKKDPGVAAFVILLLRYMALKFFLRLGTLLKFGDVFARTEKGDMYSSNTAVYPNFRGRGLGMKLFSLSEEVARKEGLKRVVVDVKADNTVAINLRQKLGYKIEVRLPAVKVGGKTFEYVKMVKYL